MISSILRNLKSLRRLWKYFYADLVRYSNSVKPDGSSEEVALRRRMIMACHQIEKGLGMPAPRLNFGQDVVNGLIQARSLYFLNPNKKQWALDLSRDALLSYSNFHCGEALLESKIKDHLGADLEFSNKTGVLPVSKMSHSVTASSFDEFFLSRYSVRDFTTQSVDIEILKECIKVASKTPSVCNRQPWRAIVVTDKNSVSKVMSYQTGCRGFVQGIPAVIVVFGDLSLMTTPWERNQPYIDGGMFSMSIALALHSRGLGAVCLNLCHSIEMDREFHAFMNANEWDVPIMMIAVGYSNENAKAGVSARLNDELVTTFVV